MAFNHRSASGLANDYANLRTIPALLGIVFTMSSLYQFGGISTLEFVWFNYTMTVEHATFISLGAYGLAFASSETKQLENYETWEKILIGAGPVVIMGYQFTDFVNQLVNTSGNFGGIAAFMIVVASWGVAVR